MQYTLIVCRVLLNLDLPAFPYLPNCCSVFLMMPVKKHGYAEQQSQ